MNCVCRTLSNWIFWSRERAREHWYARQVAGWWRWHRHARERLPTGDASDVDSPARQVVAARGRLSADDGRWRAGLDRDEGVSMKKVMYHLRRRRRCVQRSAFQIDPSSAAGRWDVRMTACPSGRSWQNIAPTAYIIVYIFFEYASCIRCTLYVQQQTDTHYILYT